jgi:hypothetical protein
MITEFKIKSAIRRVTADEKPRLERRDGGPRGGGRLVIVIRGASGAGPTVEFYAAWQRGGRRLMSTIGTHPVTSLADARKRFREEFAPTISAGDEPTSAAARRRHRKGAGTVAEPEASRQALPRGAPEDHRIHPEGYPPQLEDAFWRRWIIQGNQRPVAESREDVGCFDETLRQI